MKKIFVFIILTLVFFQTEVLLGQSGADLLKGQDISKINIDALTEADIVKISQQIDLYGITVEELGPMVIQKGMKPEEFAKLKKRLNSLDSPDPDLPEVSEEPVRESVKTENIKKKDPVKKDSITISVFGSDIFDDAKLSFEPNSSMPIPSGYVLGQGDELSVSVFGLQQLAGYSTQISPEGTINIKVIGSIFVSGLTIEEATKKIKAEISKVFKTVATGQSQVIVSLTKIRTIKITIIGGKQPGNYSVSSLSTVYNALFISGGPGKTGSYRNIELLRNNKVIGKVDIYSFLVSGNMTDNLGLKDNDVINIPIYTNRVTLEGEVKRPGIFEIKEGETLADLLSFASGFTEFAYTNAISVQQKTGNEFKIADIKKEDFKNYKPSSGDSFKVSRILQRYENRITITGAVFRPNTYSFTEGMRISELIDKAGGLKEDAYKNRIKIIRLKPDLTKEFIQTDLVKVFEGNKEADIILNKEDIVTIYSVLDFKEKFKVTIDGEINKPGEYDYRENLSLNDLLVEAGGLKGSSSKRVEIARMIKSDDVDNKNLDRAELFNIEITPEDNEQAKNFELMPYDVISIRRMAVYEAPATVSVLGGIVYPGSYVLLNKREKIYDIIERAGGLSIIANIEGIKIRRQVKASQKEYLRIVRVTDKDNNGLDSRYLEKVVIPIDWKRVLRNKNSNQNIVMLPGDEIEVSFLSETVRVTGNVILNSEIPYKSGKGFKYYLRSVGGVNIRGWERKSFIIYPNGRAEVARNRLLFFKDYPKVIPGSQIVVPDRHPRQKISIGEIAGLASVLSSVVLVLVTVLKK